MYAIVASARDLPAHECLRTFRAVYERGDLKRTYVEGDESTLRCVRDRRDDCLIGPIFILLGNVTRIPAFCFASCDKGISHFAYLLNRSRRRFRIGVRRSPSSYYTTRKGYTLHPVPACASLTMRSCRWHRYRRPELAEEAWNKRVRVGGP